MNSKMATPGSIQGGRGNLPNTHFWHDLKKKSQSKAHIFFKMAKILHTGNTWFESGGEGGIYQIPTNVVVWKKPPKADFFFSKWLRYSILATPGLNREGRGGIYQIPTYGVFWKKATQKWRQNGKDGLATRIRLPHIGYVGLTTKNL